METGLSTRALLRIIDVNANRASEGLRVCEEVFRFLVNDRAKTEQLKGLRHQVADAVRAMPFAYGDLLQARESVGDVGADLAVGHGEKVSVSDLFLKNMKRAQEALRSLEEFSKCWGQEYAVRFQALRFALYQAEKESSRTLSAG